MALDLRGHGESGTATSDDYELPAHAADLATVLADVVPRGGSYVLVGHSWGGAAILGHAREVVVEGLAGAVFVGSSGSAGTLFGIEGGALPIRVQATLRLLWVRMFRVASALHRRPVGRYLTAPSLVLRGRVDRQDTRKKVHELVAALPDVEMVTLEGVGHGAADAPRAGGRADFPVGPRDVGAKRGNTNAGGGAMTNRLAASTSPYLLQHADNPVHWYEWGEEAFAEARRRDVPLLISVGYAACHWCHVMAHESFEDAAVAEVMNASFVCVKVDREERPDVDAVYMAATQAMSGQGGWPMTVFTTPDGEPFYAGTYYPPRPAHGRPSFLQLLDAVAEAWQERRDAVRASATAIRQHLRPVGRLVVGGNAPTIEPAVLEEAVGAVRRDYDVRRGGFGGAPKFPPSMLLEWLLRHCARTRDVDALAMATGTLEAMARGGIYDQIGGGFARYSVDADWVVPHFEKMLYDNALLLRVSAHAWRATGSALARRVTTETAEWMLRELRTPEGGFASSLDADSLDAAGRTSEGAFYVWTPGELIDVLGHEDGAWAAQVWSVTGEGTFEHGSSVLQLREDVAPRDEARYADVRGRLFVARERRARPGRDDKVVAGWNGLAIAALAEAGALLDRPEWVESAASAADLLLRLHRREPRPDGRGIRLFRTSRQGVAGSSPAVLEDYAHLADALLTLYSVTGDERWTEPAELLLDTVLEHFPDTNGTFFDTADDDTDPVLAHLGRPQDLADGPTPSGTAAAAGALTTFAALTGSLRHRETAERAVAGLLPLAVHAPRAVGWALAVAEAMVDGPREVAVIGPLGDSRTQELHRTALLATAPGAVVAVADPATQPLPRVPLVLDRPLVDGRPAAYVCRHFACERPTTDPGELARSLA